MKGGLTDKAIVDYTTLLNMAGDNDDADTYYNLGIAYNKLGEKANAVKMLIKAEMLGHEKAGELLMKSFSEHLISARQKVGSKLLEQYSSEFERNKRSPILSNAFGKLWVPNMSKFLQSNMNEVKTFPASVIKAMLSDAEKDMFLITPEGLLLFEGTGEPIEAYYSVEIESEHSILLEVQPTKGGETANMRILFHEGNLLLNYPIGEAEIPAKYFLPSQEVNNEQKERLTTKKVNIPYMDSLESTISSIVAM
jgi:tetratricopeptide (TPR) repeat protein